MMIDLPDPQAARYQWGQSVCAAVDLYNDGSLPDAPEDALLVVAGGPGEIVQVGHHADARCRSTWWISAWPCWAAWKKSSRRRERPRIRPSPHDAASSGLLQSVLAPELQHIVQALAGRTRYRYVQPLGAAHDARREGLGWVIVSPNCSRQIDPHGRPHPHRLAGASTRRDPRRHAVAIACPRPRSPAVGAGGRRHEPGRRTAVHLPGPAGPLLAMNTTPPRRSIWTTTPPPRQGPRPWPRCWTCCATPGPTLLPPTPQGRPPSVCWWTLACVWHGCWAACRPN
jgi:hypothetical protein